jgi:formylglycine-generating enzyme required for sulfatase activity
MKRGETHPVTYEDFDQWAQKQNPIIKPHTHASSPDGWAVNVSWHEANAYARSTGSRLPTKEEWDPRVSELAGIYEWVGTTVDQCALRGGGWDNPAGFLRSALRYGFDAGDRDDDIGFRVVSRLCERCGSEMFRMHSVWRCPSCGHKTDCCGW